MAWVRDVSSFYDFIGYVVLRAPDRFPKEDYLPEAEQMNLERAFAELRKGIALVELDNPGADERRGLSRILDETLSLYKAGYEVAALTDFKTSRSSSSKDENDWERQAATV
ncbi:hypothetical protein [Xenophilus sp. Marseille-Q4582]|uniref:hypothetical protein n=1 Tax=Xenophilus sp. Marseille-Q4582 TaxID=2866600 RepID=UPI001CE47DF7|nr:hypothetical protein [Xenophilus sp. Marseille-Q4582]